MFDFDNSFARELEGFFIPCDADPAPAPRLLQLNSDLAAELGLDMAHLDREAALEVFSGRVPPPGALPLAQAYAGHQFGGFSHQLGDGRALLLGEVIDINGARRDIQLKGSGRTPFSRGGDGKATVGPVLREYLIGEAMNALAIPTTRGLAAVATGDRVMRERLLPGAVLTRVAASHLRVGTFQFFAARQQFDKVRQLADYSIARHYPQLAATDKPYLGLIGAVRDAQARLVAQWMLVGFIHGVMNTDNMTISGQTIDYGPCAFIDAYDPGTVFSSIDEYGRYRFGNQPAIAQWNLARFAETLLNLIDSEQNRAIDLATEVLDEFGDVYQRQWLAGMRGKLGWKTEQSADQQLIADLLGLLTRQKIDFTLFFRNLSSATQRDYHLLTESVEDPAALETWLERWTARCAAESDDARTRSMAMNRINPITIPRNHQVESVLSAALDDHDLAPFERFLAALKSPFAQTAESAVYATPAPASFGPYRTYCGT